LSKPRFTSFTMILPVCNEESRIQRVLDYYKNVAPLVVCDNFSRDRTREITENNGVQVIQKKNDGSAQTPEWTREVFSGIDSDYVLWLSSSEFIPMTMLEKFDEIAQSHEFGMVENVVISHTCGEEIPLWGGRFNLFNRRIQRFFNRHELNYDAVYMHAPFQIKDPARCKRMENSKLYNIIHLRDSDAYSLLFKHLSYSVVEARQIVENGKSFTFLRLILLLMKEGARLFLVPFRQWHGVAFREIWARIVMHTTIYCMVWELKNDKGIEYSKRRNSELWGKLMTESGKDTFG